MHPPAITVRQFGFICIVGIPHKRMSAPCLNQIEQTIVRVNAADRMPLYLSLLKINRYDTALLLFMSFYTA